MSQKSKTPRIEKLLSALVLVVVGLFIGGMLFQPETEGGWAGVLAFSAFAGWVAYETK